MEMNIAAETESVQKLSPRQEGYWTVSVRNSGIPFMARIF